MEEITYSSGSHEVRGFLYTPSTAGPHPGILALHTAGGLSDGEKGFARALAEEGYAALVIDYFTPHGLSVDNRADSFSTKWGPVMEDIQKGLEYLGSLDDVGPDGSACVGFSMGGYYAFCLGVEGMVQGAVSFYGVLSDELDGVEPKMLVRERSKDLKCPILVLHGADDPVIPAAKVQDNADRMAAGGKDVEQKIYQGAGHRFNFPTLPNGDPCPGYSNEAELDSWGMCLEFLGRCFR